MGFVSPLMAVLVHVLAGTHAWLSCALDAAIHQWRQLGTSGSPHMGSCRGQLVADVPVLDSDCHRHEAAVCLGPDMGRSLQERATTGPLRRRQDPLLPQCSGLLGAWRSLLRWLGDPLLF